MSERSRVISNPLFASQTSSADKESTEQTDAEYGYTVLIVDDEVEVHKVHIYSSGNRSCRASTVYCSSVVLSV